MAPASEAKPGAAGGPLRLSRLLHARRETVFKAWTEAAHVQRWFCPEGFTAAEVEIEPRVGGVFALAMRSPAGEVHRIRGSFVELAPVSRLVIDMRVTDKGGKPLFRAYTEVDFSEALGGTQLDLVQTYTILDPASAWMVGGAPQGWRSTLDQLEREVVRLQGGGAAATRSVVHAAFHLERSYDAPVARVWKALTDPAAKAKWFGGSPGRWEPLERQMDVRAGGHERVSGRWEGGWSPPSMPPISTSCPMSASSTPTRCI